MLDIFFAMMAAGLSGGAEPEAGNAALTLLPPPAAEAPAPVAPAPLNETVQIAPDGVVIGQNVIVQGVPAASPTPTAPVPAGLEFNMSVVPAGLVADPQTPSGKFTTATEIKPILNATKGNWVAVRDYGGQDLLYVTHLWSWRCGLKAIAISINSEPMQNWPMPPCHMQFVTPNAILPEDPLPFLTLKQGAVQTISIQIVYDDLSMDAASFARGNVLIP